MCTRVQSNSKSLNNWKLSCISVAVVAASVLMQTNLEVKVSDLSGVEVVDALQDLLDELSGLFLAQRLLLGQEVKQLTPRDATGE